MNPPRYQLEFFNASVKTAIDQWPSGIRAKFYRIVAQMEISGANLGMPYTKAIGEGLFEIRAKGQEGIGRAFYCTMIGARIVILHGFIKKTEQTPKRELDTARARLKELKHEHH